MTKKTIFDAVDCSLRDICNHLPGGENLFGGIPVILGGDFQQILPVVPRGDRAAIVMACLQYSRVWPHLECLILCENMRLAANDDPVNREFAQWLAEMSHNEHLIGKTTLPDTIFQTSSVTMFAGTIYPADQLHQVHQNPGFFISRAILSPYNRKVDELNEVFLHQIEGELHTFNSHDQADVNENAQG
jgi:hypothetical protein